MPLKPMRKTERLRQTVQERRPYGIKGTGRHEGGHSCRIPVAEQSAALGVAASGYLLPLFCLFILAHAIPLSPPPHPFSLSRDVIMRRLLGGSVSVLKRDPGRGHSGSAQDRGPGSAPFFNLKGTGITLYRVFKVLYVIISYHIV